MHQRWCRTARGGALLLALTGAAITISAPLAATTLKTTVRIRVAWF